MSNNFQTAKPIKGTTSPVIAATSTLYTMLANTTSEVNRSKSRSSPKINQNHLSIIHREHKNQHHLKIISFLKFFFQILGRELRFFFILCSFSQAIDFVDFTH